MNTPLRLLIVDDEDRVRRALRMRLQLDSCVAIVGEAADGPAALAMAATLSPHVVLLDVNLPGMNGLEACVALSERGIPVVMFSLDDSYDTRERSIAAGAASFVSKRCSARDLLTALHAARAGPQTRAHGGIPS